MRAEAVDEAVLPPHADIRIASSAAIASTEPARRRVRERGLRLGMRNRCSAS
jgi:hypothetical protein